MVCERNVAVCQCGSKKFIKKFDGLICYDCRVVLRESPYVDLLVDTEWEILSSATKELGRGIELITQALEKLND